jgi:hypothetical protein
MEHDDKYQQVYFYINFILKLILRFKYDEQAAKEYNSSCENHNAV